MIYNYILNENNEILKFDMLEFENSKSIKINSEICVCVKSAFNLFKIIDNKIEYNPNYKKIDYPQFNTKDIKPEDLQFEYFKGADNKPKDDIENLKSTIRYIRSSSVFPIINRGKLGYDRLTESQLNELEKGYQNWLDITDTLKFPETPSGLDFGDNLTD